MHPWFHSRVSSATVGLLLSLSACADDGTGPELEDPRLFVTASAGFEHTCAITTDGTLLCWGRNRGGVLGDGTTTDRSLPAPVLASVPFGAVSAGHSHACALTPDGEAYCWGENYEGQLGIGTDEAARTSPARVNTNLSFSSLSAGGGHTCAVDQSGKVYCWGSTASGQAGAEGTDDCWAPCTRSPAPVETDLRFEEITAGSRHTCGLARDGGVYCWGANERGQLGTASAELCGTDPEDHRPCSRVPLRISSEGAWEAVRAGGSHTCALDNAGTVHCWGWGWNGELGDGLDLGEAGFRAQPGPVAGDLEIVGLGAGPSRSCAISAHDPTYCWGSGEVGDGSSDGSPVPVAVATSVSFIQVVVGGSHSCGLSAGGVMYCWGSNRYGQLGEGSYALGWPTPVAVRGW